MRYLTLLCMFCMVSLFSSFIHAGIEEANQLFNNKQYPSALERFLPLAESGNAEAQTKIASMYLLGYGVLKEYPTALRWLAPAKAADYPEANYWYGICLLNGYGLQKTPESSVTWFEKAAKQGYVEAQSVLGIMYMEGIGVKRDYATAYAWNSQAANNGHPVAMYHLGQLYEKGVGVAQDDKAAVHWYALAAKKNETNAEFEMGVAYDKGIGGLPKDLNLAIDFYTRAANKGSIAAQFNLALIYDRQAEKLTGEARNAKLQQAIGWLKKASEAGNGKSTYLLADYYTYGIGVAKDTEYGHALLKKAAEQGDPFAQKDWGLKQSQYPHLVLKYGKLVQDKQQTNEMLVKAFNTWQLAADNGSKKAIKELALAYQYGWGVDKDLVKAAETYLKFYKKDEEPDAYVFTEFSKMYRETLTGADAKAIEAKALIDHTAETSGSTALIRFVARCHHCHHSAPFTAIQEKDTMAQQWYSKAATLGDAKAKLALTTLYKHKKDYAELAKRYRELAEMHDMDVAKYNLAYMYIYGEGVTKSEVMARDLLVKINYKQEINNIRIEEPQLPLARLYANGGPEVQDAVKAQQTYLLIASHQQFYPDNTELIESAGYLAEFYFHGYGKTSDFKQAYFWKSIQLMTYQGGKKPYMIGTVDSNRCFYTQEEETFAIKPFEFVEVKETPVIKSDILKYKEKLTTVDVKKVDEEVNAWIKQRYVNNVNVAP
jgi:TPR repeat protein